MDTKISMDTFAQIRALEESHLNPDVRSSREQLLTLLDEDFCEYGSSGRAYTRDDVVGHLVAAPALTWEIDEFAVRLLASDVALATYRLITSPEAGSGGDWSRRSSVWKRYESGWRLCFHQGTPSGAKDARA